ncbi:ABC transporter substrate-binding protein [Desulfovibrio oxyclinae]|jgi:branched-chain amino acid transport system substrate-binding protein|uniref:ABC transporter substrate-binding protein n=1 Tax=Desulfovibrio oxyclinae TaxID=63560 RepID=UPI00039BF756|nr:ABC transporter substrate-binding protein [Desulfovibrio oxyclinae]
MTSIRSSFIFRILSGAALVLTLFTLSLHSAKSFADEGPILVASIFAHTGPAAEENTPNYRMVRLAVERINETGGLLGRRLELLEIDNQSTALGSREAARDAVKAGVTAVIGPSWSSHAMAMAPVLQRAGIPMVGATTTAPEVTQVGDFIFRICYTNRHQALALARFAVQHLKAESAAVLSIAGEVYSEDLAEGFAEEFVRLGGEMLVSRSYLQSSMDFSRQLTDVQSAKPDVVFVPGFARDSGLILKQARTMGMQMPFLGGDGWTALEQYPHLDPANGDNYYTSHWHPDSEQPESLEFIRLLKKEYGPEALSLVDSGNPCAYDAMMIVADAIRRAGSASPGAIRNMLLATKGYHGVTGTITFNGSRDPLKPLVILQITQSGTRYIKTDTPPGHEESLPQGN